MYIFLQWLRRAHLPVLFLLCIVLLAGASTYVRHPSRRMSDHPLRHPATSQPTATPGGTDFTTRLYLGTQGKKITYYLYVPHNYDRKRSYPLLLFLHGVGERWNDTETAKQNSATLLTKPYIRALSDHTSGKQKTLLQDRWPCFVVVPQIMDNQRWVNASPASGSYTRLEEPSDDLQMVKDIVDHLQAEYTNIDATRRYITGFSMGGQGTWDAIERWPDYFAAAVPVSGASDPAYASTLVHLPIWTFQGDQDSVVAIDGTRKMVAAISAIGGHPRFTEIPGADHDIWSRVYVQNLNPDLYPWLFSQHKGS